MKSTNYCEILSLLYGILIHEIENTNNNNNQTVTETTTLNEKTMKIANNAMTLLNTIAILDLDSFQVVDCFDCSFSFAWMRLFEDHPGRRDDLAAASTRRQLRSRLLSQQTNDHQRPFTPSNHSPHRILLCFESG